MADDGVTDNEIYTWLLRGAKRGAGISYIVAALPGMIKCLREKFDVVRKPINNDKEG